MCVFVYKQKTAYEMRISDCISDVCSSDLGKAEEYTRGMVTGGTLFEELGFYYVGPIDGHNLDHLIPVLENVRDTEEGPILVHVVTKKGKGYAPAENAADKYHGVQRFDVITGRGIALDRKSTRLNSSH